MIYFKDGDKCESLEELIKLGFTGEANPTLFKETYSDKECTIRECREARRSFGDLLVIARTYFPDTTEQELMKALSKINFYGCLCGDIGKVTFKRSLGINPTSRWSTHENYHEIIGKDGYSINQLKQMLNE